MQLQTSYLTKEENNLCSTTDLEGKAGEVVAFDARTLHQSLPNTTDVGRAVLAWHVMEVGTNITIIR